MTTDLERYCRGIAAMFTPVEALAAESGSDGESGYIPAWGNLLDVQLCPAEALGWLAMFVGVAVPTGATEAEARALISAHGGFSRGTLASIEAAIARVLGAGEPFTVEERTNAKGETGFRWWFLVFVQTGKVSNALYEAINAVKSAGMLYAVVEVHNTWLNGVKRHWTEVTVSKASEMVEPNY